MGRQLRPPLKKPGMPLPNFISYRRFWLDYLLDYYSHEMSGLIIDLGGKRENKRGIFRPLKDQLKNWWYVNLDIQTNPNIFGDVSAIPIKNNSVNVVICTEVLEHLENPAKCADELHRILRTGGTAFVSVPFMYPIHADPYDFQRFTDAGLQTMFNNFSSVEIIPMGGYLGVLGMFIELGLAGIKGQQIYRKVLRRLFIGLAHWLYVRDIATTHQPDAWTKFTTGYFLKSVK